MNLRGTTLVAAAVAAAALAPSPAAGDPLVDAERRAAAAEQRLDAVERAGAATEETPAARAARRADLGERQYGLGDWLHAAMALVDAVDEPAFRSSPDRPHALFLLADALRRQGACGGARVRYAEYLAVGDVEHRSAAFAGALDCAVTEHRAGDVAQLLSEAGAAYGSELPAEVRYLAAKGMYQRTDVPAAERYRRASEAFEQVGPPFQLQAAYFQGVIRIQLEDLDGAIKRFEACAEAEAADRTQADVRELCMLAAARVHAQKGDGPAALRWYAAIPHSSPRFPEAMNEVAWTYVRSKQYETALRMASFVPDLLPESPLAPEATVLQGNLLLKLGRYAEATDVYNRVINAYAPVRDEIDALLSMQEDPVRYFNELIGRQGKAFDVATVLPPVAVKWASTSSDVAVALDLVRDLDAARRELDAAAELAARIEALLGRGGGLDAFPRMQRAYADASAIENDAARTEGELVAALSAAAEKALPAAGRGELARLRQERAALEARLARVPRTPDEVTARFERTRARIDEVGRAAYRLGYDLRGIEAAIDGTEAWMDANRAELAADPEGREELTKELRKQRDAHAAYERELREARQEIARARDVAAGAEAMAEEERLRADYLEAVARERGAAETAPLAAPDRALLERSGAIRERLAAIRRRARAFETGIAREAASRAGALRDHIGAEKAAIAANAGALDVVQAMSKDVVGRIAVRAIGDVRTQFYRLVLKADLGIVDVAWSRKRARLDKIQQLSMQKAAEVDALDREYRAMLREAE